MVATCSLEGEPNITEISQVHLVDENHVALSHQFFNKTQRNVRENPHATIQVFAPVTYDLYQLQLRFDHSESEGPLFEEMSARLQVIASHTGMLGVFKLRSADVYEVLSVEQLTGFFLPADPRLDPPQATTGVLDAMARELRSLRAISDRVNQASCLEVLLENVLQALDEQLGFHHSMVLLPDGRGHLVTTASHGYGSGGVGAEVPLGEGLIGTVAARQRPMRVAGVGAELRYWRTIRAELQHAGNAQPAPEIPLPGLPDAQAQLALPLLVGERLVGVLALESREAMAFDAWTETFLNILANQIALGIDRASSGDEEAEPASGQLEPGRAATAAPAHAGVPALPQRRLHLRRRRVPHPEHPGEDPLEAPALPRRERADRVQQPGAPPRRLPGPSRAARQPRVAADPPEEATGGEVPRGADPPGPARPVRAPGGLRGAAPGERLGLSAVSRGAC